MTGVAVLHGAKVESQHVPCILFLLLHKVISQVAYKSKSLSVFIYSRMRSDGFDEESQRDYWRSKNEISGALEDDFLKTKSWNKKLYDYESNIPDRFVTTCL